MDGQLALVALDDVVELVAEREVLAVLRVLELVRLEDVGREVLEELAGDLGRVDVDRLDLLLDLLLLVGEVLVEVAVALHVRLRLQQVERLLHLLAQRREIETETVVDEHGEVAGRGLEGVDVLHQEQRLQQAVGEDRDVGSRIGKVLLGLEDGALCCGLQRRADPGEHLVERGEVAHLLVTDALGDLLDHAEHGPLADRAVLALEHVVVRETLDRRLEHRDLVGHERIGADEATAVNVVAVRLRAVDEVEDRLEVRTFLNVDGHQFSGTCVVLLKETLADDLLDVLAGELHLRAEPCLDLGEVISLLPGPVADDLVHVLLGGDEDP